MAAFLAGLWLSAGRPAAQGSSPLSLLLLPVGNVPFDPTDIAISPLAGDDRLFVVQQNGLVHIVEPDGTVLGTPFLDITDRVFSSLEHTEMGLLGFVFHPQYETNGYFYVNYTIRNEKDYHYYTRISRFQVMADPDIADPNSEQILLVIVQPFDNHNGGDLNFGPDDGYLYIALGDGGGAGDPFDLAQSGSYLLGKILRIDVDGGFPYTIPPDNPFVNNPAVLDEIWDLGLRNPWRFSFDRLTGNMWIGDVGEEIWEEIDWEPAGNPGGRNYGWRCYEGLAPYNTTNCGPQSSYISPVHVYSEPLGGCAVVGGYVYRGSQYPALQGYYLFADFCSGRVWGLDVDGGGQVVLLAEVPGALFSTFGEGRQGEPYLAGQTGNTVYRLVESSSLVQKRYLPLIQK